MRRRRARIAATLIIIFLALIPVMCLGWRLYCTNGSRANGDAVIAALHSYKSAYGRYPSRLSELVPKFIAEIPAPIGGDNWEYEPSEKDQDFWLSFDPGVFRQGSVYDTGRGAWKPYLE
jgi:hypothetical protein